MTGRLIYFGKVDEQARLTLTNDKGFRADLRAFAGKEIRLTIEKKSKRNNARNAFFHGVVVPIVKAHLLDLGWEQAKSSEWVKNYIKFNCLIVEYANEDTGEVVRSLGETSTLDNREFDDFIEHVQRWATEKLGLYIPDRGEQMAMEM